LRDIPLPHEILLLRLLKRSRTTRGGVRRTAGRRGWGRRGWRGRNRLLQHGDEIGKKGMIRTKLGWFNIRIKMMKAQVIKV
jgi:hypothetical protein